MKSVNVNTVNNKHLRVVIDGVMVLAKLGEAIGAVVQRLHVVGRSVFHLVCIVLDSCWEAFHLTVDETTVRVDDRIRTIKLDSLVEVMDRILESIIKHSG